MPRPPCQLPPINSPVGVAAIDKIQNFSNLLVVRRRVRREIADIKNRLQQSGFRQNRLRLHNYICRRVLTTLTVVIQPSLHLRHALLRRLVRSLEVPSFLSWQNSFHFKVFGRCLALV